jgi:hypothetical protein
VRLSDVPRLGRVVLLVVWSVAPAVATAAQDLPPESPILVATRLDPADSVRIDGTLDEDVWRRAASATSFTQRDPDNGAPASEPTEVRVVYDSERLIIGAQLRDQDPDGIRANQMQRDGGFDSDDRFIVSLDTFLDRRNGYVFQVNPAGAIVDGLINAAVRDEELGSGINRSWDGIWTARVRRGDQGWTVELEIPFRTLNFDATAAAWGINFQRTIRRKSEEVLWTASDRSLGVTRMASAGRLEGLAGLSQGLGLDVKPYAVGNVAAAPGRGRDAAVSTGDVGVDVLYNLTPALRTTVSVNTDFAETEVDQRQVNLTRFPLFFEEKRDFFLQGGSYFDFAREQGQAVMPFFSRRIGLDAAGLPQPIDIGAKLTGSVGAFDLGVLQVRTGETDTQTGADFTVARVRRRFLRESYVGVLYTRRDERLASADPRHTVAADVSLRTSTFLSNQTIDLSGWYINTSHPLDLGQNLGRGLRLQYPNDPLFLDFSYRELQPNYQPAVGFIQRVGFRRYNPEAAYTWHFPATPLIRSQQVNVDPEFIFDRNNRLVTRTLEINPLMLSFDDGSAFQVQISPTYDRLERAFEIVDDVELPAGTDYSFTRYEVTGETARQRPLSAGATIGFGGFYSGHRREFVTNVQVRPRAGVSIQLEAERNILDLAEGNFTTDVFRIVANTQFSPRASLANNLQYDSVSRSIGWQARFRWIQRPGNDLFVVYTHNWQEFSGEAERAWRWLDNRLATKLVYTLRF